VVDTYIFFTYVIFFCIRIGGFFRGNFCFSKDEITYNLLLLQTDGIVVAEVKDFVIRSIEKSDRSNGDIAHKIVWTEIELCTGANYIFLPKMFLQDFFFNICSVIWYVVDDIDVMI
jgi:hypothetical protein